MVCCIQRRTLLQDIQEQRRKEDAWTLGEECKKKLDKTE
jgi:hypothetical protein